MIAPGADYSSYDFDTALMLRVRDGDRDAFSELMERNEHRVFYFINSVLKHSKDPDDLTQQVFLRVYRARQTYLPTAQFSTWLFTIARNVVLNARRSLSANREVPLRRLLARVPDVGNELWLATTDEEPSEQAISDEIRTIVRDAIGHLSRRQQQVLRLVCLNGDTYDDASNKMGISPAAIKSLLARARKNLRSVLREQMDSLNA